MQSSRPDLVHTLSNGIGVDTASVPAILQAAEDRLQAGMAYHICTLNPEIVELARRDLVYRRAVQAADMRCIDGIGIALSAYRHSGDLPARVTGRRLSECLVTWAMAKGRDVVIIGATGESRLKAEEKLRDAGVRVLEGASPELNASGVVTKGQLPTAFPDRGVVLAAFGAPKQEFWIRRHMAQASTPNIYVGVGGTINYISGHSRTPPVWIGTIGLEWVFRLATEFRGRWRRQLTSLSSFVWHELILPRRNTH